MLNVMVDPPHAAASAPRRLPAPLSAFVVTTGSVVHGRVIVAVADPLLRPVPTLSTAACTAKLPGADESSAGVNLSPALPSAYVMNWPLPIGVVPSCWNSVPFVMLV